jgi:hypothetical protein
MPIKFVYSLVPGISADHPGCVDTIARTRPQPALAKSLISIVFIVASTALPFDAARLLTHKI